MYKEHKIKKKRLDKNLTQQELSIRTGIDQAYISQTERGIKDPPPRILNMLNRAINGKSKFGKRKCKYCGKEFERVKVFQSTCSVQCAVDYGRMEGRRKAKEKWNKAKKDFKKKSKTYTQRLNEARKVFQAYIRKRDEGLKCICCDTDSDQWDAGHYYTAEKYPALIFNEDNCNLQRKYCNNYLHGNQRNYRLGLIERIGIERVEALDRLAEQSKSQDRHKYTNERLEAIKRLYRWKIKKLQ